MKYIAMFVFLFSAFGLANAQSGMVEVEAKLDAGKLEEANADLSQIEIDFCDHEGEKAIAYTVSPGNHKDICYRATNSSDRDITVTVGFVDGTFTNDQRKNKACKQQGEIQKFGQYVTGYTEIFTVGANNISYQHAYVQLPSTSKGTVNGCLVYYTKGVEMGGQMNFTVLMRKAKFIDINIKPKAQSLKLEAIGILFGGMLLLVFFTKFHKKKTIKKTTKKTAYKK